MLFRSAINSCKQINAGGRIPELHHRAGHEEVILINAKRHKTKCIQRTNQSRDVLTVGLNPDIQFTGVARAAVRRERMRPTTRNLTPFERSNAINSLKSLLSKGQRLYNGKTQCFDRGDALRHGPRQPIRQIARIIIRRMQRSLADNYYDGHGAYSHDLEQGSRRAHFPFIERNRRISLGIDHHIDQSRLR